MTSPRRLDIHILQSLPHKNLDRDDLGISMTSPASGAQRTRISREDLMRAVRESMQDKPTDTTGTDDTEPA